VPPQNKPSILVLFHIFSVFQIAHLASKKINSKKTPSDPGNRPKTHPKLFQKNETNMRTLLKAL
jgi:hypothetical protein